MSVVSSAGERERDRGVMASNLVLRIASAAFLSAVSLAAAYAGGILAGVVAAFFATVVQFEWAGVTGGSTYRAALFAVVIAAAIVLTGLGLVGVAAGIALATAVAAAAVDRSFWLAGGIVYGAVLGIGLVALRVSPEFGLAAVVFVFAVVWATDIAAYFAGRSIGGAKLWPRISPNKTWSGAIGGLVASVAAAVVAAQITTVPVTPALVAVAIVLSVVCQIGDLFESWVKRRFGAKDAGAIIPGHGGVMDRVDGLTFAAGAAVLIGAAHAGPTELGRGLLIW